MELDLEPRGAVGQPPVLHVGGRTLGLVPLHEHGDVTRLPRSLKVLLENLLRHRNELDVTDEQIAALASWDPAGQSAVEIAFRPGRVFMHDTTGVPGLADLAAARDAVHLAGGDPGVVNPQIPVDLVIDHSVSVDAFAVAEARARNVAADYRRNGERYAFLKWAQLAFDNLRVVPPGTGIMHQINVEYLATVVADDGCTAYPDTLVGTDSHTPMVNSLGVLGWGVGGIEGESAMLGQPVTMLVPRVVGVRLAGSLSPGVTATDLVLTLTEQLRRHGVVGKFVEFYGPGLAAITVADRATIANMSPEYGSTCSYFPIDAETVRYLTFTGRSQEHVELIEAYARAQGMWHDPEDKNPDPVFSEYVELDLSSVEACVAGPRRPQDRVALRLARSSYRAAVPDFTGSPSHLQHPVPGVPPQAVPRSADTSVDEAGLESFPASDPPATGRSEVTCAPPEIPSRGEEVRPSNPQALVLDDGTRAHIDHGAVVIAAITSCTNTSNPGVMIGAGLIAKKAVELGLERKPWVKTSLAPGSKVVTSYLDHAGLTPYLDKLGFNLVGYGCTTCIGQSGPLPAAVTEAVSEGGLASVAVLSGNRNFEGRINPDVRMSYLASPPLVVAYALAGTMDIDLTREPLGTGSDGRAVYLRDIWPSDAEISEAIAKAIAPVMFSAQYSDVLRGDEQWAALTSSTGSLFAWDPDSTYIRRPPHFEVTGAAAAQSSDIVGARILVKVADSITTDHISPAGAIQPESPAGRWLTERGIRRNDFNSYASRRGNHEVMVRGTFANIRLRNQVAPGTEGGYTRDFSRPDGPVTTIYGAACSYARAQTPLVVVAGKDYGGGSSRDWAAKGARLLGVRAVLAESFERIHRSNLVGMGILPLEFEPGEDAAFHGIEPTDALDITGIPDLRPGERARRVNVRVVGNAGSRTFRTRARLDTDAELAYYRAGGIMQFVLSDAFSTKGSASRTTVGQPPGP